MNSGSFQFTIINWILQFIINWIFHFIIIN